MAQSSSAGSPCVIMVPVRALAYPALLVACAVGAFAVASLLAFWIAVRPPRIAIPLAAALSPRFTTLLMDLRYFGQSGGHATTLGLRERRDLARVLDFLAARGISRAGVFGFSLGGAVALMTAAGDPRIAAVVAYAPFADLEALGLELYAWMGPLRYPLVRLITLWGRLFLGGDLTRPSPLS